MDWVFAAVIAVQVVIVLWIHYRCFKRWKREVLGD